MPTLSPSPLTLTVNIITLTLSLLVIRLSHTLTHPRPLTQHPALAGSADPVVETDALIDAAVAQQAAGLLN